MDAWIGVLAILVGLAGCFLGYLLFRLVLIFAGLFGGYLLSQSFVPISHEWLALPIGIAAAILMAVLAYPLWSIGVFVIGAALGIVISGSIAIVLGASQSAMILLGAFSAAAVGFLFYLLRDLLVMLTTALSGAVEVVYGIGCFIPILTFRYVSPNLLALTVVFVLGSIGFLTQYVLFKDRRTYSSATSK